MAAPKTKKQPIYIRCKFCENLVKSQKSNTHYSPWFDFAEKYGILPHLAKTFTARNVYIYCAECNKITKTMERKNND